MVPSALSSLWFPRFWVQLVISRNSPAQVQQSLPAEPMANRMVEAEPMAWSRRQQFFYRSKEISNRTNGRLRNACASRTMTKSSSPGT
jgi:hypothetical protein